MSGVEVYTAAQADLVAFRPQISCIIRRCRLGHRWAGLCWQCLGLATAIAMPTTIHMAKLMAMPMAIPMAKPMAMPMATSYCDANVHAYVYAYDFAHGCAYGCAYGCALPAEFGHGGVSAFFVAINMILRRDFCGAFPMFFDCSLISRFSALTEVSLSGAAKGSHDMRGPLFLPFARGHT